MLSHAWDAWTLKVNFPGGGELPTSVITELTVLVFLKKKLSETL